LPHELLDGTVTDAGSQSTATRRVIRIMDVAAAGIVTLARVPAQPSHSGA